MAPKQTAPVVDPSVPILFSSTGLSPSRTKDLLQASRSIASFQHIITVGSLEGKGAELGEKKAGLCVDVAKEWESGKLSDAEVNVLLDAVKDERLKSSDQVKAASSYLINNPLSSSPLDIAAFNSAAGVGISFTPETLLSALSTFLSSSDSSAITGWDGLKKFRESLKTHPTLRWASGKDVATAIDQSFVNKFGAKVAPASTKASGSKDSSSKDKSGKDSSKPTVADVSIPPTNNSIFTEGFLSRLHAPGGNPQISAELKKKHLDYTGGRVMTRFPPEPNGYLHIGHAKAITIDFGYAKFHNGCCYLRFDDTNPSAEEGVFFDSILEMVRWLGFEPWRITYSSDNFQKLFEFAMELTKRGKAYICHCDQATIALQKGSGKGSPSACPHRERPLSENIAEFQAMKDGKYKEKGACLRMKIDLTSGNPYLWDPVAYRVKDAPHHRTGNKWKIYPSYDFAHPLCDSLENISHSLCTLEFIDARASYEWLCDALEVYKPRQYETARLQLQGTFLSKRKIRSLVENGHVKGWDDPRLFTLIALRRRGVPPAAMLRLVAELGVSTSTSEIKINRFEQSVRQTLELSAARLHVVLEPVKLTIENVKEDWEVEVEKALHPKVPEMGKVKATLTKHVFIEKDDFRVEPPADFNRLSPGKSIILMGSPFPVTCTDFKTDPNGGVTEIICQLEDGTGPNKDKKFKAKDTSAIHWVAKHAASNSPVEVDEVRFFDPLFKSEDPSAVEDFESDINPNSLRVFKGALIEPAFFGVAKQIIKDAKVDAEKRTKEAQKFSEGHVEVAAEVDLAQGKTNDDTATTVPKTDDDTPIATADQLVGMECIRFQGMRLAYFTIDKEAVLGCLDEGDNVVPGRRAGDKLILNQIVSLKEEKGKKAV